MPKTTLMEQFPFCCGANSSTYNTDIDLSKRPIQRKTRNVAFDYEINHPSHVSALIQPQVEEFTIYTKNKNKNTLDKQNKQRKLLSMDSSILSPSISTSHMIKEHFMDKNHGMTHHNTYFFNQTYGSKLIESTKSPREM